MFFDFPVIYFVFLRVSAEKSYQLTKDSAGSKDAKASASTVVICVISYCASVVQATRCILSYPFDSILIHCY